MIYSSSVDGSIALCEEASGRLSVRYLLDFAFAQNIGISYLEHAPSIGVLVCCSTSTCSRRYTLTSSLITHL